MNNELTLIFLKLLNDKVKTRKDFLTTTEWQREKSLEFANLRLNVDKNRKCFKKTSQDFSIVCLISFCFVYSLINFI